MNIVINDQLRQTFNITLLKTPQTSISSDVQQRIASVKSPLHQIKQVVNEGQQIDFYNQHAQKIKQKLKWKSLQQSMKVNAIAQSMRNSPRYEVTFNESDLTYQLVQQVDGCTSYETSHKNIYGTPQIKSKSIKKLFEDSNAGDISYQIKNLGLMKHQNIDTKMNSFQVYSSIRNQTQKSKEKDETYEQRRARIYKVIQSSERNKDLQTNTFINNNSSIMSFAETNNTPQIRDNHSLNNHLFGSFTNSPLKQPDQKHIGKTFDSNMQMQDRLNMTFSTINNSSNDYQSRRLYTAIQNSRKLQSQNNSFLKRRPSLTSRRDQTPQNHARITLNQTQNSIIPSQYSNKSMQDEKSQRFIQQATQRQSQLKLIKDTNDSKQQVFDKNYKIILRTQITKMKNEVLKKSEILNVKCPQEWQLQKQMRQNTLSFSRRSLSRKESLELEVKQKERSDIKARFNSLIERVKFQRQEAIRAEERKKIFGMIELKKKKSDIHVEVQNLHENSFESSNQLTGLSLTKDVSLSLFRQQS
ncbi:UNKNOWN [Stylonychia lemnae]|uniref:Uncharacterized protein n=1 Tax=Stylonychia lemnae TaxID=5949 RepID=A0A078AE74_STYLE|nr:UNKNOWN [Stylonychia lemnae]|eukprot:CDW80136.1 UNKNOWN [Stylonychia lemnae]